MEKEDPIEKWFARNSLVFVDDWILSLEEEEEEEGFGILRLDRAWKWWL